MVPPAMPLMYAIMRAFRRPEKSLANMAHYSWDHATAQNVKLPSMIFLDDGLDAVVSGPDFGGGAISRECVLEDALCSVAQHGATRVHELRRCTVSGGSVYSKGGRHILRRTPFSRALKPLKTHLVEATLVSSLAGSNFFGHWLLEDCAQQLLAEELGGELVDIERLAYQHEPDYRELLDLIEPRRLAHASVSTLRVIEDEGATVSKIRRILRLKERLWRGLPLRDRIPGVFVKRGQTGSPRKLLNEKEVIARVLSRGFQLVSPEEMPAVDVASLLARSRVVVGVDGSHMFANPIAMQPGSCSLELHPANRFYPVQRMFLGPLEIHYSVLVCENRDQTSFVADLDHLERLLDVCQRRAGE